VSCCLKVDPTKRDTTKTLLQHRLFTLPGVKSPETVEFLKVLTNDMPTIEKRFAEIQEKKKAAAQSRFSVCSDGRQNMHRSASQGAQGMPRAIRPKNFCRTPSTPSTPNSPDRSSGQLKMSSEEEKKNFSNADYGDKISH